MVSSNFLSNSESCNVLHPVFVSFSSVSVWRQLLTHFHKSQNSKIVVSTTQM